ncbi:MAG: NHL repeat-containing protein, partial [Cyanobacteriota bacterium]
DCKIRAFDNDYNCLFEFGGKGNSNYNLKSASSMTISENNIIYVSDYESKIIKVFTNRGIFLKNIGREGEYKSPFSLSYINHRLFVLDNSIPKVQVNSKEGRALFSFGKRGANEGFFSVPRSISLDIFENIYITDKLTHRIEIFDNNGNFIYQFGSKGIENGKFNEPESISISDNLEIFVLDRMNSRVQVFKVE